MQANPNAFFLVSQDVWWVLMWFEIECCQMLSRCHGTIAIGFTVADCGRLEPAVGRPTQAVSHLIRLALSSVSFFPCMTTFPTFRVCANQPSTQPTAPPTHPNRHTPGEGGSNLGVWIIKRGPESLQYLQDWWDSAEWGGAVSVRLAAGQLVCAYLLVATMPHCLLMCCSPVRSCDKRVLGYCSREWASASEWAWPLQAVQRSSQPHHSALTLHVPAFLPSTGRGGPQDEPPLGAGGLQQGVADCVCTGAERGVMYHASYASLG